VAGEGEVSGRGDAAAGEGEPAAGDPETAGDGEPPAGDGEATTGDGEPPAGDGDGAGDAAADADGDGETAADGDGEGDADAAADGDGDGLALFEGDGEAASAEAGRPKGRFVAFPGTCKPTLSAASRDDVHRITSSPTTASIASGENLRRINHSALHDTLCRPFREAQRSLTFQMSLAPFMVSASHQSK